jgi:hypothetical protein
MSERSKPSGATGAGSEAAEGIHGANTESETNERAGSEPLADREKEHRSGYGGAGGKPVKSSHQRDGESGPKH